MIQVFNEETFSQVVGVPINDNMRSILAGLQRGEKAVSMGHPHRLVPYLAQLGHESAGFRYDREVWGPTPAQARYDTRTDLGNTPARDGDGYKYRGRTGIQITGRYNTQSFRDWCRRRISVTAPDFVKEPDLMNTDPWEGLGPLWYWESRDLNRFCDVGDFKGLTEAINGGLNGYADRCQRFTKYALLFLGYKDGSTESVWRFQYHNGLVTDGVSGPKTRQKLHQRLTDLPQVTFSEIEIVTEIFKETPKEEPGVWSWFLSLLFGKA